MPLADRDPVRAAHARITELEQELSASKRDVKELERQRKYWASTALKYKRNCMLLSAAFSGASNDSVPLGFWGVLKFEKF